MRLWLTYTFKRNWCCAPRPSITFASDFGVHFFFYCVCHKFWLTTHFFFLSITFLCCAIHINCGVQNWVEMNSVVNFLVMLIFNFDDFQLTWSISRCWIYHLKRFIDIKIHCHFNILSGSKSIGDQWNAYIERKYLLDKLFFPLEIDAIRMIVWAVKHMFKNETAVSLEIINFF